MTLADRLRRLDDAWMPAAARRWRRFMARGAASGVTGSTVGYMRSTMQAQPALAGSIAVVLAAGILFATVGTGPDSDNTSSENPVVLPTLPTTPLATIGPSPGTSVPVYLTRAAHDLEHYGEIAANRPTYAVVDFRQYLTPDRAKAVLGSITVVSAYVRVPSQLPTLPRKVPLTGPGDLATGITTAGTVAAATANSYAALLKALHPGNKQDRELEREYQLQHRSAAFEAAHLTHPATCQCVFAAVVQGLVEQLNTLVRNPDVRVVDPAPPVVPLTGLTVLPLQPQVRTVVPRDGLPGG